MRIVDNVTTLLGDDLKSSLQGADRLSIAAAYFSIYAYEALREQLEEIDEFRFIFTSPTFVPNGAVDKIRKERRQFFIPSEIREGAVSGGEFEIKLRNKMTQRAVARECANWIRRKARFRSNATSASMQQFAHVEKPESDTAYTPLSGFTAVDLGYQAGDALSSLSQAIDEPQFTKTYLSLIDQLWSDGEKLSDVTSQVLDHIESVYQENSPERIYFVILYNLFSDFLSEVDEDVLPNDKTGYQDSLVWKKLFNYQKDAAVGIINKLETYNGCILADSVGLGKTFTALAVVKYYELRNRDVLVLCPKKLADNWRNYNANLTTNIFAKDRFRYDAYGFSDEDRREELFFIVAREFQEVTEDPRPFDRLIEYSGPSITFRQTLDPAWRARAIEVLHPGCKPSTIQRNFLGPLTSLDRHLRNERRNPGCDTRRMFWLTPEQAEDLLAVAGTPERYGVKDPQRRIRSAIAFLLGTGCRTGESFVLAAEDINWNTRECLVRGEVEGAGKTKASTRLVYLPSKSTGYMEGLPDKGPILLNRKGQPYKLRYKGGGQIRREFKKLREAADLPKECTPHSLRHSFATWTYAVTKDMKLLMSRGGWAKHDTALRYTKLAPSDLPMRLKSYGWDFGNDLGN